ATHYDSSALMRDAILSSISNDELVFMQKLLASRAWQEAKPSREIFLETLVSCIVRKRDPEELRSLLAMLDVDKDHFGWHEKTILTGRSIQGYRGKIPPLRLAAAPGALTRDDLNITASQKQGLAALPQWPGSVARAPRPQKGTALTDPEQDLYVLGRKLYLGSCSGCHGSDGGGLNRFAPPLQGSEWVTGDPTQLVLIVLHGLEGPLEVAGKRY